MARGFAFRSLGILAGAGLLLSACSQADASQSLTILDSDASSEPVPEAVISLDVVEDSVRFLGEHQDKTYFVARHTSTPKHEVCLVEMSPSNDEAAAACSDTLNMTDDKITTIEYDSSAVALVADEPSTSYLEEAEWQNIADNLWVKDSHTNN